MIDIYSGRILQFKLLSLQHYCSLFMDNKTLSFPTYQGSLSVNSQPPNDKVYACDFRSGEHFSQKRI